AVALPIGIASAIRRGTAEDAAIRVGGLIGLSIPNFWLATLLLLFLPGRILPIASIGVYVRFFADPAGNLTVLALPAFSLGVVLVNGQPFVPAKILVDGPDRDRGPPVAYQCSAPPAAPRPRPRPAAPPRPRPTFAVRFLRTPVAVAGAVIVGGYLLAAGAAPVLAPGDPLAMASQALLAPPGGSHPFGTDQFGRDVASRLLYGARVSLSVSFASVL